MGDVILTPNDHVIVCKVKTDKGQELCLTNNENINIGDLVAVSKEDDESQIGEVVNVRIYDRNNLPRKNLKYILNKVKSTTNVATGEYDMTDSEHKKSTIDIEVCDITKVKCDAIVNAANKSLLGGGGVDGAIHRVAGPKLLEECKTLHGCETGQAKITKGYNLPAKFVIHTVGPIYSDSPEDKIMLTNCYQNSLTVARENNLHTIAFSAISTGVYGYPLEDACQVALIAVGDWLEKNSDYHMEVLMTCFDDEVYDEYEDFIDVYDDGNDYIYDAGY